MITNPQTGTVTENVNLPFGTQIANESTNASSQRKFTSYERSTKTGLDYAQNRTYDPKQGRFTQVDPIGINAVSLINPQSLNMYAYCGNDPINNTDPNGLFWGKLFGWLKNNFKWIAIAASVATLVALTVFQPWTAGFFGKFVGVLIKVNNIIGAVHISPFVAGAPTFFAGAEITGLGIGSFAGTLVSAVGAITSHFAQTKDQPKKKRKPQPAQIASGSIAGKLGAGNPCPSRQSRFFENLDLYKDMARQLNTDPNFLMAHSSHESGWLDDHNFELHNLFGTTKAGGNNLRYPSFKASADYYIQKYGQYLYGAKSMDDFVNGLKNVPPNGYNVVTAGYYDKVRNQLKSIEKWEGICGVSP